MRVVDTNLTITRSRLTDGLRNQARPTARRRATVDIMRLSLILLAMLLTAAAPPKKPGGIDWQPWSDTIFEQAKRENKFVLLDLEAVWCHWCHVMDETTYKTPEVIALI